MIHVIRHGNKRRIVYLHIKERMSGINEFNDFVSCPDCGEECGVESYD